MIVVMGLSQVGLVLGTSAVRRRRR